MVWLAVVLLGGGWWLLAMASDAGGRRAPGLFPRRVMGLGMLGLRAAGFGALVSAWACFSWQLDVAQATVFWAAGLMLGALATALVLAPFARPQGRRR